MLRYDHSAQIYTPSFLILCQSHSSRTLDTADMWAELYADSGQPAFGVRGAWLDSRKLVFLGDSAPDMGSGCGVSTPRPARRRPAAVTGTLITQTIMMQLDTTHAHVAPDFALSLSFVVWCPFPLPTSFTRVTVRKPASLRKLIFPALTSGRLPLQAWRKRLCRVSEHGNAQRARQRAC